MINSIDEYLFKLRRELLGCDPDIVSGALSDSEEHLREALNGALEIHFGRSESELLQEIIKKYGTPNEIASTYKIIEARKHAAGSKKSITIGLAVFSSTLFTAVYFLCQGILLLFYKQFHWPGFGDMVLHNIFLIWAIICLVLPVALGILARHIWISYRYEDRELPFLIYLIPIFPFLVQGIVLLCYWSIKKSEWWDEYGVGAAQLLGILSLSLAFIMLLMCTTFRKNLSSVNGKYKK